MPSKDPFHSRLKLFYIAIFFLALIVLCKLFFVQVLNGATFKERAEEQYVAPLAQAFNRGLVFFKRKDGTLLGAATLQSGYTVAINPSKIDDALKTYTDLALFLPNLDKDSFLLKAGKHSDPYEEIARRVAQKDALVIQERAIPGVSIFKERWRVYPSETLESHVIGFVGFRGDAIRGQYGIERYYDDVLSRGEKDLYVNFFAEIFANVGQSLFYQNVREGDVVLTIEPEVARFLEQTLISVKEKWDAKAVGGVIINPRDGSIYAMASRPAFDPNEFQREKNYSVFSNPIVENVYEMGSIMKPLTVAAGLDAGVIRRESTYTDQGFVELDGRRIENHDGKAHGTVSIQEVLNQSLNTGAVHVMRKLGKEKFRDYFLQFGLGEETGIDLPNEVSGLVDNLQSPRDIEYATASFGQGIATTPIAMARALSVLANGGVTITPHVVDRIEYALGDSRKISYGGEERILYPETAEEITRMLVAVVDDALLEGTVKMDRYSIAAKTGTAQISDAAGGGYFKDRFFHSFFGYFPAFDPKFLVFLFIEEPKGIRYAAQSLTPPFMEIAKFLLHYYEIPPDR